MGARDDVNSTLGAAFPGLPRGQVRLVPYDPAWPAAYEREAARLQRELGCQALAIMVAIPRLADVAELEPQLVALGYVFHPRDTIPDRHFFIAGDGDLRRINLSLVEPDSAFWRNHLAFRDALRARPEVAANYARLKAELARLFPDDRLAYTEAKGSFVTGVLAATAWAERGPGTG